MENKSEWKQERTWPVIQGELNRKGRKAIAKHNAKVQSNLDEYDPKVQEFLKQFENL